MKKKRIAACAIILCTMVLSACGVKSTRQLKQIAKSQYGPATVISENKGQNYNSVVLEDKLQGFAYTISSGTSNVYIDGSSLGEWESTSCDFGIRLKEFAIDNSKDELNRICSQYNATWQPPDYYSMDVLLWIFVPDPQDAKAVTEECAKVLQQQNVNNRMDGIVIFAKDTNNQHLGQAELPGCSYH